MKYAHFAFLLNTFLIEASEDCLTFTSLHAVSRSVLHDGQDATCFTIPEVKGVTPLQKIELTPECRNRVENNQIELEILVDGMTTGCQDLDSLFSVLDNECSKPNIRRCKVDTGSTSNHCNASCDCSTGNCTIMLLANPGLKSTGWNMCEVQLVSSQTTTTTTTTTTRAPEPIYTLYPSNTCSGGGSAIKSITTSDFSPCKEDCNADSNCDGFTFGFGQCFLKPRGCTLSNVGSGYTYYRKS